MTLYQKNTKLSIVIRGDGEEIFKYELPHPAKYKRNNDIYTIEYIIEGYFHTNKGIALLNDLVARFAISMNVLSINTEITTEKDKSIKLKDYNYFNGLKSIQRPKEQNSDTGQDNVFWSIKLFVETFLREKGDGSFMPYSMIESYALDFFKDSTKDKSTLKAKCRSIWNWYNEREWKLPKRRGKGMTQTEAAKFATERRHLKAKEKVLKAITELKKADKKINSNSISKIGKVNRRTAKKILEEYQHLI